VVDKIIQSCSWWDFQDPGCLCYDAGICWGQ